MYDHVYKRREEEYRQTGMIESKFEKVLRDVRSE